jgi:hypothetical protein
MACVEDRYRILSVTWLDDLAVGEVGTADRVVTVFTNGRPGPRRGRGLWGAR